MLDLRPFQKRFLRGALAPNVDTAALSLPRGEGKSALAAHILERCLTPDDSLFVRGAEYLLCASSMEQARNSFRPIREALEPVGTYRFIDSQMRLGITHKPTNTRLRVMSSNAKTAFGIVDCPLLIADEPGGWETVGGQLMHDAIQTAQGKPESPLRVIYIGTLAPSASGWWHDLIADGSVGSTYVQALIGDLDKWDQWPEIRRCNPLKARYPESRRKLLLERDKARSDPRLKAQFLSYRLNRPSADESEMLLTVDDFELARRRDEKNVEGKPIVGIDLGAGRAWSAAVAIWESGRVEALAVAPGIPSLSDQEKRDRVPAGTYQRLHDRGLLDMAEGLRVQPPARLWESVLSRWGTPVLVVCDRFRLAELEDAIGRSCNVEARVTRWSEAAADIRTLRRICRDGPLSIPKRDQLLLATSLAVAYVKSDDAGSVRLTKRGKANAARDDVAAALLLAAGAYGRYGPSGNEPEPVLTEVFSA